MKFHEMIRGNVPSTVIHACIGIQYTVCNLSFTLYWHSSTACKLNEYKCGICASNISLRWNCKGTLWDVLKRSIVVGEDASYLYFCTIFCENVHFLFASACACYVCWMFYIFINILVKTVHINNSQQKSRKKCVKKIVSCLAKRLLKL